MKTLQPIDSPRATHLEIELYYSKGGMNYFNYKQEPRGYYFSVTPITKKEHFTTYTGFSGIKQFIHGCERKSDKQYKIALSLVTKELREKMIEEVSNKLGLKQALSLISKELGIGLPPRFEGMTKQEIEALPVLIVSKGKTYNFANLAEAKSLYVDFSKLCGPFGCEARDHLRFETQEAYNVLSQ